MNKKTEIVVEKFAQGITLRCKDPRGDEGKSSKALAAQGYECGIIGKEVWRDISDVLNESTSDKVRIKLEYEAMED